MVRLATFNTFWLGTPETEKIRRTADDEAAIVALLKWLDADVLLFQEVVNLPYLQSLLDRVRPDAYRLKDAQGHWLTTGRMRSRISHLQKIALAFDARVLDLLNSAQPFTRRWPGPREPIVGRFRHRASRFGFVFVGVHLKSGGLLLPDDSAPSQIRRGECETLVRWLLLQEAAAAEAVIVMGDFNAAREHASLAPLRRLPAGWTWHSPGFEPDRKGERWSSFGERSVIDHVITSKAAGARVIESALIRAFDIDPAFDRPQGTRRARIADHFLRHKTDLWIQPDAEQPAELAENIYRISDHRPLVITLVD